MHPEDQKLLKAKLEAWSLHQLPLPSIFELREMREASEEWLTFEAILHPHPRQPNRVFLVLRNATERSKKIALDVSAAVEAAEEEAAEVCGAAPDLVQAERLSSSQNALDQAQLLLKQAYVWPCGMLAKATA